MKLVSVHRKKKFDVPLKNYRFFGQILLINQWTFPFKCHILYYFVIHTVVRKSNYNKSKSINEKL